MRWTLQLADPVAPPEAPPPAPADTTVAADTANRFHALLCMTGTWSGDKRFIDPGQLTWPTLPVPLMGQDNTMPEHMEAIVVGSIDRIEYVGNEVHGYGSWSADEPAARIRQLVRDGHLRGVSADMDDVDYEVILPAGTMDDMLLFASAAMATGSSDEFADAPPADGESAPDEAPEAPGAGDTTPPDGDVLFDSDEDPQLHVLSARVIGATITPFPAFQECFIEDLDPGGALIASAAPVHHTDTSEDAWNEGTEVGKLTDPITTATADAMFAEYDDAAIVDGMVALDACEYPHHFVGDDGMPAAAATEALDSIVADLNSMTDDADGTRQAVYDHVAAHYSDAGLEVPALDPLPDAPPPDEALVAAARITPPVHPPAAWFAAPNLREYTPLTITDDGRVFGHVAEFGVCHIGFPDSCVTAPKSASNYAHFHVGEVRTAEGTRVAVGHLALRGGHADERLTPAMAKAFYDNTLSCIADLCAGEDRYGIWVAGALRPEVTPAQVRAAMASGVSGDWRRIRGSYELIQLSNVNVPGFNSPRARIREVDGLVASMTISMPTGSHRPTWQESTVERIAASIGRSTADRRRALHERVHAHVGTPQLEAR